MRRKASSALLLLLLAVVFMAVAGFFGYLTIQKKQALSNYEAVNGTIDEASQVEEDVDRGSEGSRTISYRPIIQYSYSVNGRKYTNDNIYTGSSQASYSQPSDAENIIRRFNRGEEVVIHYDPKEPSSSYLIRDESFWTEYLIIGAALLASFLVLTSALKKL